MNHPGEPRLWWVWLSDPLVVKFGEACSIDHELEFSPSASEDQPAEWWAAFSVGVAAQAIHHGSGSSSFVVDGALSSTGAAATLR